MTDQQLQQKLMNAEVSVPNGAWEQLLAVLEEDADNEKLEQKLNACIVSPPAQLWNRLEPELDELNMEKLFASSINRNELTPPAFIWDNIEENISQSYDQEIAEALIKAEMQTPESVWALVEQELHPVVKVVPITKWFTPLYRIAAAAVVIGLLTWAGFQWLKKDSPVVISTPTPPQIIPAPVTDTPVSIPETSIVSRTTETPEHPMQDKLMPVRLKSVRKKGEGDPAYTIAKNNNNFSETNYLLVLDEKGDLIRVSKKLGSMECAKNNEMPVDAISALQVKDCDEQIKRLQQRLATSVLGSVLDPCSIESSTEK